eukprot:2135813-Prymnesium_polylepis.1
MNIGELWTRHWTPPLTEVSRGAPSGPHVPRRGDRGLPRRVGDGACARTFTGACVFSFALGLRTATGHRPPPVHRRTRNRERYMCRSCGGV